ncbi:hypothetical protein ABEF93_007792 [Exophiala dermatitidis]
MDAPECELLVHITACSTVQDDKRYAAIAQSILDFRPATVIRVFGAEFDSPARPSDASTTVQGNNGATNAPVTQRTSRQYRRGNSPCTVLSARLSSHEPSSPSPSGAGIVQRQTAGDIGQDSQEGLRIEGRHCGRKRRRLTSNGSDDNAIRPDGVQEARSPAPPTRGIQRSRSPPLESPVRQSPKSITSTMSPSQPVQLDSLAPGWQSQRSPGKPVPAIVDLTTPEHPQGTERFKLCQQGHSHPQQSASARKLQSRTPEPAQEYGTVIRQLPDHVTAPHPRGGRPKFTTHITKTLEKVSARVPLAKYFRPAFVARDVGVLERGYWQFSVKLGPRSSKQPRRSPAEHAQTPVWTEQEFEQFWHGVSQFISQGKAGFGTRLTKDPWEKHQYRIRVFTWAEILGHIWIIMWILSDKLTQGVPMQWIAGDGSVVVQMPGAKMRRHRSSIWMKKGPEGEGGVWGMAELVTVQDRPERNKGKPP